MTSIEKLFEDYKLVGMLTTAMVNHYQEMHKQEIVKAFDEGQEYEYQYHINNAPKFDSETYYQETFKS